MIVRNQVAGRVGGLPVTPERESQAVPAHAGELRHVLVDHFLAIGVEVARGAVVPGPGQPVGGAEEAYRSLVASRARHALVVDGNRAGRALRAVGGAAN